MQPSSLYADLTSRARPLLSRLPAEPPALLLCLALNRLLLRRLPADVVAILSGHRVDIDVTDIGLCLRLRLTPEGFGLATGTRAASLRIAAESRTFWNLARGTDDADRLFFERALVMEGDTELGLVIKNTLDAIGPLW